MEASVYLFVLAWVPTLTGVTNNLPVGIVFSLMMLMSAAGSWLAGKQGCNVCNVRGRANHAYL